MNIKRAVIIVWVLVIFILAGTAAFSQDKTTIRLWGWGKHGKWPAFIEETEQEFERRYPNVDFKVVWVLPYADYMMKLKAAIVGGDPPEIAHVHPGADYHALVNANQLRDITEDLERKDFPRIKRGQYWFDWVHKIGTINGRTYGVPIGANNLQVSYNQDIFEKYALEEPRTQEELIKISKKLREQGIYGIALGDKDLWSGRDLWVQMAAYTEPTQEKLSLADMGKVSWKQPEFVEATQMIIDLVKAGVFAPGINAMDYYTGAYTLYARKKAAMFYPDGPWIYGDIRKDIPNNGIFVFPPRKDQEPVATGGSSIWYCIPRGAKHVKESLDYMKYLQSDEMAELLLNKYELFFPIRPLEFEIKDPLLAEWSKAQANIAIRSYPNTPEIYEALASVLQAVFDLEKSAEEFVADVEKASRMVKR